MWVHLPSTCCPSAPVSGASISDSNWRSQMLRRSVTSSGRLTASKSWLKVWRKGGWIRRLYGRIYEPSTASRGVASWIASLRDTRASPSPVREREEATKTPATSGPMSQGSSNRLNRLTASSRTCRDTFRWDLKPSSMTCKEWVTRLRRACLLRQKSVPLTRGKDSSSSQRWPTVTAGDASGARNKTSGRSKGEESRHHDGTTLNDAIRLWSTPMASDSLGEMHQSEKAKAAGWAPRIQDQARGLMTSQLGHQDQTSQKPGQPSYDPTSRLNPLFVEWLMGLPSGWSGLGPVGTGWSPWSRRMRGELSRLP